MKVLVTGVARFIGGETVLKLVDAGHVLSRKTDQIIN